MMMMMFMHGPRFVPSQPRGSMVGVFWQRHITVREGFGCNTQQLGSSFYCNTLQFKLGSQCGIRDLDRWLYRFDSAACVCVRVCVYLFVSRSVLHCVCFFYPFLAFAWAPSVSVESEYILLCLCLSAFCLSVFLSAYLCLPAYTCLCMFICVCVFHRCVQAKTSDSLLGCDSVSFYNI